MRPASTIHKNASEFVVDFSSCVVNNFFFFNFCFQSVTRLKVRWLAFLGLSTFILGSLGITTWCAKQYLNLQYFQKKVFLWVPQNSISSIYSYHVDAHYQFMKDSLPQYGHILFDIFRVSDALYFLLLVLSCIQKKIPLCTKKVVGVNICNEFIR